MMKQALAFFPLKMWPLFGMAIFMVMFLGVLTWVYRRGSDLLYEEMSYLPLDKSENERHQGGFNA